MPKWPVAIIVLAAVPVMAAPEAISVHSGWGAFRNDGTCYAIAMAQPSPYSRERQPFASISMAAGKPRFTMRLSRTIARDAVVTLDVGNRRFRLEGGGDSAWGKDDSTGSGAIIEAIRLRSTMTVGARDTSGRRFRDAYDLTGAPTAMDAALLACR